MEINEIIRNLYIKYLERDPTNDEIEHYLLQIQKNQINLEKLIEIFENCEERQLLIKTKNENKGWSENIIGILKNQKLSANNLEENEPSKIFVSCFNDKTDEGGVYLLKDSQLEPIFSKSGCYGIFFDKKNDILFSATRKESQIVAFKINENESKEIPVLFSKYIFAEDIHGIIISENKIITIATNGDGENIVADNAKTNGQDRVGKIIISDLEFKNEKIYISNSKSVNLFQCTHHHHINDIITHNNEFYLCCHSYCDKNKKLIDSGVVIKTNFQNHEKILDGIEQPHSISINENKIFFCASSFASLLSIDMNGKSPRMEYKGIDAYMRGMAITKSFFYLGYSVSFGRTNSKFNNARSGLIMFNRKTGETKKIDLPEICDNIYSITTN